MSVEELGSGPADQGRPRRWVWVLAAVAVAGVAWVALRPAPESQPVPTPSRSPSPSDSAGVDQRPGTEAQFRLGEVCGVTVTGRRMMVRFTLTNPSAADLVLLRVEPVLPLSGLTWERTTLQPGACDGAGPEAARPVVSAGHGAVVTFTFTLPPTCPQALPVRAGVTQRVDDVPGSGQRSVLPVLPDLGSVDFTTCP